MHDALTGVTVLEVGVLTPGKYCGYLLVGWGARSIRIERAPVPDDVDEEDLLLNRGKQSVVLNLKEDADRAAFLDLARGADVLIESYRPGVADRLGIGYGAIRAVNQGIVYCSLSGFGQHGPSADRAAYDLLFQAETGFLHALSANGSGLAVPQTYVADAVSGLMAAFAIAAALQGRSRSGQGRHIDLSMQESVFSLLSVSHGTIRGGRAIIAERTAAGSRRPTYNVYATADRRHVAITALGERSSRALFGFFGREDLWEQGLAAGDAGRAATEFLASRFAEGDAHHWIEALSALGIEIGPVRTPGEAFDDPQLVARNMSIETEDRTGRRLRQIGHPATSARPPRLGPAPLPGKAPPPIAR